MSDFDHDHLAVIMTGSGKAFSVGLDLQEAPGQLFNDEKDNARNSIQV